MKTKTITVFGSSMPKPGEEEYENAYLIGKLLAQKGFNFYTGGAQGIMDAVSKGAVEEGSEAIGITVAMFNAISSKHLTKEIKCDTLFQRIDNLLEHGDGFIILPGGTGTLLEISIVWELINKNIIDKKPNATLGNLWNTIVNAMDERLLIEKKRTGLIKCFNTVEETVNFIEAELLKNRNQK